MFKFKPTNKTYSDPVAATFVPGIPFGREYSRGDICLLNEGFQSSKMFLNSKILREAILNSKEYLEEVLEISIKDKKAIKSTPKKDMKVVEVTVTKTPKSKESLVLESEELKTEEDSDKTEE